MLPGDVLTSSFHPEPLPELDGSLLGEKEAYVLPTLLLLNQGGISRTASANENEFS